MTQTYQPDGSIKSQLVSLMSAAGTSLRAKSRADRLAYSFWLLGPFILLIERTPADIWLSVLALAFVVRSIVLRDGQWLKVTWVRLAFAFWFVCLLSALLSSDPGYAFGEAFAWFRFPLFAMATVFWLAQDRRLLYAMLLSTAVGMVVMCGILAAEVIIIGQQNGRLSWPYGDLVPGSYLAKAGLPAFTIAVALAVSLNNRIAAVSGFFILVSMVMSLLTGERINFLIRSCSGMLAAFIWKPKKSRLISLIAIEVVAVVVTLQSDGNIAGRFMDKFIDQLPTGVHSPYYRAMMPGVLAAEQHPVLGVGTGMMRNVCSDVIASAAELDCHTHPHNFYVQLAGETGLVGLTTGTIFMLSIVWTCFKAGRRNRDNVVAATAFIIPLSFFWPIAATADFFGQWNNIFMWSGVALALAATNLVPDERDEPSHTTAA